MRSRTGSTSRTSCVTRPFGQGASAFASSMRTVGPAGLAGRRDTTQHATAHLDIDDLLPADRLDDIYLTGCLTLAGRNDCDVLRPHTHGRARRVPARSLRGRKRELDVLRARDEVAIAGREVGRNEVHRW